MKRKKNSIVSTRVSQRSNVAKGKGKVDEAEESLQLCPYFDNLPTHLITHILLQLPIKSLLICKCVCKIWKTLISEPHFAKLHFDQAPISFMIRTNDVYRVSKTLHLLEFEPEKFVIGSNDHVKLEPIFKLPLSDVKSFMESSAKLVMEKNNVNYNGGRQKLNITCNKDRNMFDLVNSCNGLLCLSDRSSGNPVLICNPVTGEFIRLPEATKALSRIESSQVSTRAKASFGFQPKTNEYKVIKMWMRRVRRANHRVFESVLEIHTLGTPSWRNVEVDPHISISRFSYPTCVNGALHWIRFNHAQMSIFCFNFENERLVSFPSPPHVFGNDRKSNRGLSMGELKGFLYCCDTSSFHDVTMWVMKEYGIGESWTKVYNIDTLHSPLGRPNKCCSGFCWPVKQFDKGACILLYHVSKCFIYFDPARYEFKVFQIHGVESFFADVILHTPSLLSLKDVVKGDNVEVLNIYSRCAKSELRNKNEVLSYAQVTVCDLTNTSSSSSDGEEFG